MPTIYQPGSRIDHYEITRLLGRGGASHVYLAQDRKALQEVVLKFPSDDLIGGAAVFARYKREAEIGKCLSHPFIQRQVNQGEERSTDYLVLEYLRGRTLRTVMKEHAPALLSTAEVIRILLQVCEALVYAHEQGVIHRDLKPENMLLLDTGEIKLLDFGIALFLKEKQRMAWRSLSSPIGTPDYMSPERLWGEPGSVQADIYPPGILEYNLALSPALATVVMHAIRRDAERRYANMRELLHDLGHLDDMTAIDYIPAPPKLGGRYRKAILITLIVLIVFLCIVLFGVLAQLAHNAVR